MLKRENTDCRAKGIDKRDGMTATDEGKVVREERRRRLFLVRESERGTGAGGGGGVGLTARATLVHTRHQLEGERPESKSCHF